MARTWRIYIALLFILFCIALLLSHKVKTSCRSCAVDPEILDEMNNPTIIVPPVEEPKEESIEDMIRRIAQEESMSSEEAEKFVRLAWCESRYNPNAVSKTNDHGLFQINARYWNFDKERIYDAEYNTRYAMQVVYPKQGFSAWVCSNTIK